MYNFIFQTSFILLVTILKKRQFLCIVTTFNLISTYAIYRKFVIKPMILTKGGLCNLRGFFTLAQTVWLPAITYLNDTQLHFLYH